MIFVGHTATDNGHPETANGVVLGNGISAGTKGWETHTLTPSQDQRDLWGNPILELTVAGALSGPAIQADSVSVFSCNSFALSSQYGNASFVGMDSGIDFESTIQAMDAAAAALVTATPSGNPNDASVLQGNIAFQKSANPRWDENGDTVVQKGDTQ